MPELPEVETVVRGLNKLIVNKKITSIFSDNPKSLPLQKVDKENFIVGAKILSVQRRAKMIIINLSSGFSLLIHLKMTGQLVFRGREDWGAGHPSDSLIGVLPDKSTRVIFDFNDGSRLFFNDQRKFGWIKLFKSDELADLASMVSLGPEPLSEYFTNQAFLDNLKRRSKTSLKAALLDQTVVSGIGNIYADEALFNAGIHPASRAGDVPPARIKNLRPEIIKVLRLSIDKGGSTNKNYVNAEGKKGNYLNFANVYARTGLACNVCGQSIIKIRLAGRGTHVCVKCQKLYGASQ